MTDEGSVGKDFKGSERGLIETFAWRDWRKPWNTSLRIASVQAEIRTEYRNLPLYQHVRSPIVYSVNIKETIQNISSVVLLATSSFILDSSVGIGTGYGVDGRGSIPGKGKRFVSSPQCPDRLWGPPILLCYGYRGRFPGGKAAEVWSWPLASI
jgi:hypothetical protein